MKDAMKNHRTKGQHYVPRAAYLEHFADQSQKKPVLWVYPVDSTTIDLSAEKGIPPKELCKETHLYESPELPVNSVERYLADIESAYSKILTEKILQKQSLSDNDRGIVALFISTLETRGPGMRDNLLRSLSSIESKHQKLEDHFADGNESDAHREIKESRNTIFPDQVVKAAILNRWQWSSFLFLFNEKFFDYPAESFFITSDQPVTLYDFTMMNVPYDIPPISPNAELIVPLTPQVLLFANNRGLTGYDEIRPNFIMEANNRVCVYCRDRVISPRKLNNSMIDRFLKRRRQSFILQYMSDPKKK